MSHSLSGEHALSRASPVPNSWPLRRSDYRPRDWSPLLWKEPHARHTDSMAPRRNLRLVRTLDRVRHRVDRRIPLDDSALLDLPRESGESPDPARAARVLA